MKNQKIVLYYRRNSAACKKSAHKNAAAFAAKTERAF